MTIRYDSPVSEGDAITAIDYYLYNALVSDAKLKSLGVKQESIGESLVVESQPYPVITFNWVSGQDTPVFGGPGVLISRNLYQIRTMFESVETKYLKPVLIRVHQIMSFNEVLQSLTLSDGTIWNARMASTRDRPFSMVENNGGKRIVHKGGFYWIDCQEAMSGVG